MEPPYVGCYNGNSFSPWDALLCQTANRKLKWWLPIFLISLNTALHASPSTETISLAGKWRFDLDRADHGIAERWFDRSLNNSIKLPGSLPEQNIGDEITLDTKWTGGIVDRSFFTAPQFAKYREAGHVKVPFWLQPEKYYAGVAWFQRDFEVPSGWSGRRIVLSLERPHWETRVWVDGKAIGANNSLNTPHEYNLGQLPAGKHMLSIRVDNRMLIDIGENSHCISDHTQGNWNGIVGAIELRATPLVWIEDVQIYPNAAKRSALVVVRATNATHKLFAGKLSLFFEHDGKAIRLPVSRNFNTSSADLATEDVIDFGANAPLWDEFSPNLQTVRAELRGELAQQPVESERQTTFGLRDISTEGTQFTINGRKTFIRGTLECCIFPRTGHPPTEVGEWKRIVRVAKSHGLNLLRFHSYCPPEAAFVAADELGMYLQVETCWANQSTKLGDGKPVDQWVYDETDRILKAHGNHPSFLLMPYGNEPGGPNANDYLAKYVDHYKKIDPRRLWTSGSGWPQLSENQFHVTPDPRIQGWGEGLKSRINSRTPETETDYRDYISKRSVPVISHEIGQWCVYPNFDEIPKYTGYLKPKNFEIFHDFLSDHGMADLSRQFLRASGKLQALCYKEDIESALRTPGMAGFELLDLHDFPGQGTALVGVLDPFWDDKGYITAKEYSRFCNSTVPLARLEKRVFTTDEKLVAKIEIAHFGESPLKGAVTTWRLATEDGKVCASGELNPKDVPIGNGVRLGTVDTDLTRVRAPAHCKLIVRVSGGTDSKKSFENDWDVWVYPPLKSENLAPEVLGTSVFDETVQKKLRDGGSVLLTIPGKRVRNYDTAAVKPGFSSIFWNSSWTGRQAPTTLGILCDPKHPALAEFPTKYHSDWQWWYLIHRAGALRLDLLPRDLKPIVRIIDDWVTARPLGLVVEGKIGAGKIVVCSMDLTQGADDPVSRQLRKSLTDYMLSKKFKPSTELTVHEIQNLFAQPNETKLRGVNSVRADSEQGGYGAQEAVDGDPNTMWHTSWDDAQAKYPHELVIEFDSPRKLTGITALPRQDGNRNGWIKDFAVYVSNDGQNWGKPVAKGTFGEDAKLKTVTFPAATTATWLKFVALNGYVKGQWTSLAEFNVLPSATE